MKPTYIVLRMEKTGKFSNPSPGSKVDPIAQKPDAVKAANEMSEKFRIPHVVFQMIAATLPTDKQYRTVEVKELPKNNGANKK